MDDLIKREDVLKLLRAFGWTPIDGLYLVVKQDIPSADRPQGWIPCSERLPNEKEVVLITNDKGNVRFGQFRGTHGKYWIWKGNTLETVLAWMPLPEKYKRGDTND